MNGLTQHLLALKNGLVAGNQIIQPIEGSDHNAQTFTVDGQLNPVITMQPNEWRVFNFVNAGNDSVYVVQLVDIQPSLPPDQQVQKYVNSPGGSDELLAVAADGNPFQMIGNPQKNTAPGTQELRLLGLPPGRRFSFLVHAPAVPTPGERYELNSNGFGTFDPTNSWPSLGTQVDGNPPPPPVQPTPLLTVVFAGVPVIGDPAFVHGMPLTPPNNNYVDLKPIPDEQLAAKRTVVFGENGELETINGGPFLTNPIFTPRLNTVEEWTLVNPTNDDHPFHLHTDPQQVAFGIGPGGPFIQPKGLDIYNDVINVPAGKTVKIRMEFSDFLGEMVYHCHRVMHEDDGMMGLVNILPEDPIYTLGANTGFKSQISVNSPVSGQLVTQFLAFSPSFLGGVNTAVADVNGDGVYDIVAGMTSGGSEVKVIDGTKLSQVDPATGEILDSALLGDFSAFEPSFTGGVFVAAGYIDGDALADVIVGKGPGDQPIVKVVNATQLHQVGANNEILDSALIESFLAFEPTFAGGVRVASADLQGNGRFAIVAGKGPGSDPRIRAFAGTPAVMIADMDAFESTFTGGVYVGTGNIKGVAFDDVIVGKGAGSVPVAKVFANHVMIGSDGMPEMGGNGPLDLQQIDSFFVTDPSYQGGVRVTSLHDLTPLATYAANRDNVVASLATGATGDTGTVFSINSAASSTVFINGLYKDVLHRTDPPPAAEADFWIQQLDAGTATRQQVALAIETSAEGAGVVVSQFYQQLFGRAADPNGLAHWVSVLTGGTSRSVVEASFLSSTEYVNKHGPDNTAYVQAVYHDVLNRAADPGGLQFWVGALGSGLSKAQFASIFLNSHESRSHVVDGYYHTFLGRAADPGGLAFWVSTLEQGSTWELVEAGILASAEYGAHVSG